MAADAITLRPYQVDAHAAILRAFATDRGTLLVLATGLGKTIVFGEVARSCVKDGHRVLVLAHRRELIAQATGTLSRMGLWVAIEQAERRVDRSALPEVVVASVLSLQKKRLESFAPETFALIVVDEAHHSVARSYLNIIDHFQRAKILGVTATPDRTDRIGLRHVYDSCAYRMEIAAGIKGGYLSPIELRTVTVQGLDLSGVSVVAGELNQGELADALGEAQVLLGIAVPIMELAAGRQTIVFCAGVGQAHELAKLLTVREVKAAAIDAKTPDDERARVLADYQTGKLQIVCNAMILTEGFDSPETSCIALARPTGSRSLVSQMIGRGTRLAEGKDRCLVIDFLPERAARIRLSAPADVLAGQELDAAVAERVAAMQGNGMTLDEQIAEAERQIAQEREAEAQRAGRRRARRRDYLKAVGVAYAAHVVPLTELLDEICPIEEADKPATDAQWQALQSMGFPVKELADLTHRQAQVLFKIADVRRARGLCTVKQAKFLQRHGLRDDVSFADASRAINAISQNGWQVPDWLSADPRYQVPATQAQEGTG